MGHTRDVQPRAAPHPTCPIRFELTLWLDQADGLNRVLDAVPLNSWEALTNRLEVIHYSPSFSQSHTRESTVDSRMDVAL